MPVSFAIQDQFGDDGAKILHGFFSRLEALDETASVSMMQLQRQSIITAIALVSKAIGEIDGKLHDHELNRIPLAPTRSKDEAHLPASLYPDSLRNRQLDLERKLEPLIGEFDAKHTAKKVTEYANQQLEESKKMMLSGD